MLDRTSLGAVLVLAALDSQQQDTVRAGELAQEI
jgi:hypothetical protein